METNKTIITQIEYQKKTEDKNEVANIANIDPWIEVKENDETVIQDLLSKWIKEIYCYIKQNHSIRGGITSTEQESVVLKKEISPTQLFIVTETFSSLNQNNQ